MKPFGLRVDLDDLERRLADDPATAMLDAVIVAGDDHRVVVGAVCSRLAEAAEEGVDPLLLVGAAEIQALAARCTTLPLTCIDVVVMEEVPRSERGKVDPASVVRRSYESAVGDRRSLLASRAGAVDSTATRPGGVGPRPSSDVPGAVASLFAEVLNVATVTPTDTFVSLGGDSLSYVECSIRLERVLGELPTDWHLRPIGSFQGRSAPTWHRKVDTTVVLRALSILTVVSGHMMLTGAEGGAHLMLAVAGYNLSRFLIDTEPTSRRWRSGVRSLTRIAAPTMAWIAAGMVLFGAYSWPTLFLVNDIFGPATHLDDRWNFWFIEVLIQLTLLLLAGLSIPAVRRWERRAPYGFVLALVAGAAAFRLDALQVGGWYNTVHRPHGAALVLLLGWLVHRSRSSSQRAVTTLVVVAALAGYFRDDPWRDALVAGGLVVLLWCRELRVPSLFVRPMAVVAAASMAIYITHYSVYPPLVRSMNDGLAFVCTIAVGIAVWWIASRAARAIGNHRVVRRPGRSTGGRGASVSADGRPGRDELLPL